MIDVRPLNPVEVVNNPATSIGSFEDSEWWDLIKLARDYGFEPDDIQMHFPLPYDQPVRIEGQAARGLYEAVSALSNDDVVPYAATWDESNETGGFGTVYLPGREPQEAYVLREAPHEHPEMHVGKVQLRRLLACAQIAAEHGGIEIRRVEDRS